MITEIFEIEFSGKLFDYTDSELRALNQLKEVNRAIFLMRFIEEKSIEEIGRKYNLTAGQIYNILYRAKQKLKKSLENDFS